MLTRRGAATAALAIIAGMVAAACSSGSAWTTAATGTAADAITAVGAENEYANVICQIGGRYVSVTAIESNPNTDPHTSRRARASPRRSRSAGSWSRTGSATTPT